MKEFAMRHPVLTFLLVDVVVCGVVDIFRTFKHADTTAAPKKTEEEEQ